MKKYLMNIDAATLKELKMIAIDQDTSVSVIVRKLIADYLTAEEK